MAERLLSFEDKVSRLEKVLERTVCENVSIKEQLTSLASKPHKSYAEISSIIVPKTLTTASEPREKILKHTPVLSYHDRQENKQQRKKYPSDANADIESIRSDVSDTADAAQDEFQLPPRVAKTPKRQERKRRRFIVGNSTSQSTFKGGADPNRGQSDIELS
ncbi:hypothetical protein SNE40_022197 [Patella caerulea]|uniref:Uncharacterized protein n=1 Tax=Patella caerulea TaxID=87958 RepID=A0AAN8GFM6_PATCE